MTAWTQLSSVTVVRSAGRLPRPGRSTATTGIVRCPTTGSPIRRRTHPAVHQHNASDAHVPPPLLLRDHWVCAEYHPVGVTGAEYSATRMFRRFGERLTGATCISVALEFGGHALPRDGKVELGRRVYWTGWAVRVLSL